MKKHITQITVRPGGTIQALIERMESNDPRSSGIPSGIALVVQKDNRLVGIVTDGDLRRGISKGISLLEKVERVMNPDPHVIVGPKHPFEILSTISAKIRETQWDAAHFEKIVVVDEKGRPLEILSLSELWKSTDVRFKRIGVVGLGYVGLTLALTLADLGFDVLGFDANPHIRKATRAGEPHFFEHGLPALLRDHLGRRFKVVDGFGAETSADVYFIAVGTPIGKKGKSDLTHLRAAAASVGRVLKAGDLVVLRSTVPIGTTRDVVIPVLERESKLKAGDGFLVSFAPERTVEGEALLELRRLPQVVGGFNHMSAEFASNIFSFFTKSVLLVDSLEEAEMVKLMNNTYRAVTFSFANEMSMIARAWRLDTKRVIEAANFGYERSRVPFPSPGVGGYCLEKDPQLFAESAYMKGQKPLMFTKTRTLNDLMLQSIVKDVMIFLKRHDILPSAAKVTMIGFAFKGKPVTSDVRGSTTYGLIEGLKKKRIKKFFGYDPYVRRKDIEKSGAKFLAAPMPAIRDSDVVILMNNNPHFAEIDMRACLEKRTRPVLLVDSWYAYPPEELRKLSHVTHYRL